MCHSCKPIRDYQLIETAAQLNAMKANAYSLVEEGTFSILHDFSNDDIDYNEVQFLCQDCGKVHILWLHTFMCRTGGEWRVNALS